VQTSRPNICSCKKARSVLRYSLVYFILYYRALWCHNTQIQPKYSTSYVIYLMLKWLFFDFSLGVGLSEFRFHVLCASNSQEPQVWPQFQNYKKKLFSGYEKTGKRWCKDHSLIISRSFQVQQIIFTCGLGFIWPNYWNIKNILDFIDSLKCGKRISILYTPSSKIQY
jgi:hypothetical protein